MHWQFRWAKNAAFGLLPFGGVLRRVKRRFQPCPTDVPEWTLEEGFRLLEMLRDGGCPVQGSKVIEVGSGWRPIIPLLYSLAGAERVVMVDTQRLMDGAVFSGTVNSLQQCAPQIAARLRLDERGVRDALADPSTDLPELLARFRIEYHAPANLITGSLPDGAFDIVTSRAVLEHVPPPVLRSLLERAFRLLRPGGWTCHAIDNSDHWSHTDRRLSRVNFLRYSDRFFGFLNWFNPLDYQNRLRHPEYASLLRELGFEVAVERSVPDPKALAALDSLTINARFRSFSKEDLAQLDSYFLARRPE